MTTTPSTSAHPTAGSGVLRTVILIMATMTTGLTASVFAHWSNTIMPGLRDVDDRTFVEAFQALDAAITNPLFLGVEFTGALLLTGLSAALHLRQEQRRVLIWIGAALVFYLMTFMITFGIHEPLNQDLRAVGELHSDADFAAARTQLDEAMWTTWNTVRAVTSMIAFGCLTWALAIHRRLGQTTGRRTAWQPSSGQPPWGTPAGARLR